MLIRRVLVAGIQADYVLMDTCFTTEPMLAKVIETGLDVIGMVKQCYIYQGRFYTLLEQRRFVCFDSSKTFLAQLLWLSKPESSSRL